MKKLRLKRRKKRIGVHQLKIRPIFFERVINEEKTFEVRKNDRGFREGDLLLLCEYSGESYTGRIATFKVKYILKGGDFGIDPDYVVMSIIPAVTY